MIQFIAVCILVGAIITMPRVREMLGRGCLLFIIGFLAIVAFSMIVVALARLMVS